MFRTHTQVDFQKRKNYWKWTFGRGKDSACGLPEVKFGCYRSGVYKK